MTLTEAQTQFNALADRLSATKAAQKAALVALGRTPTDVWDTYPDELRAVTGGTGNYQESKTVTADPAGMTILPDEGYSGMLKAIIAAEPNFQPWNLVDGIEAWGITGTAKPAVSTAPPTNLPVDKDDADTAYEEQTGAAPAETDYFVCADNNGNITYWYLSESFEITSYNPINTDFAAKGAVRMAYHTTGENAGQWTFDDFTNEASAGENYLKNIRSCTRDKLYYKGYEVWPDDSEYRASLGGGTMLYNGVELPDIESVYTDELKKTHPYAYLIEASETAAQFLECKYAVYFTNKRATYYPEITAVAIIEEFNAYFGAFNIGDTSWATGSDTIDTIAFTDGYMDCFWSNTDILNKDGTVYLAASEPVKP